MIRERKENTGRNRAVGSGRLREGRIDGTIRRLDEDIQLARYEKHTLELVIDRLELKNEEKAVSPKALKKP